MDGVPVDVCLLPESSVSEDIFDQIRREIASGRDWEQTLRDFLQQKDAELLELQRRDTAVTLMLQDVFHVGWINDIF